MTWALDLFVLVVSLLVLLARSLPHLSEGHGAGGQEEQPAPLAGSILDLVTHLMGILIPFVLSCLIIAGPSTEPLVKATGLIGLALVAALGLWRRRRRLER